MSQISEIQQKIKEQFANSGQYKILHIDDEKDIRDIIIDHFKGLGIEVISCATTDEAIAAVEQQFNQITLILSDIKMPNMDGFELRQEIKKKYPEIPFAIISGFIDKDVALRGLENKICGFLSKPINTDELDQLVAQEAIPHLETLTEDAEMRQAFVEDSEGLFEELDELILAIEETPSDKDQLNRYYAILHTIKGTSAFFNPKTLHKFAHAYEDLLKKLQKDELSFDSSVSQALFQGLDILKNLFTEFKNNQFSSTPFDDYLKLIETEKSSPSEKNQSDPDSLTMSETQAEKTTSGGANKKTEKKNADIKVSVGLLDQFMQLSGEVTVIRNMLNKCVGSIERKFPGDRDVGMLSELLEELHKVNYDVQNQITEIRKVPLKTVMRSLPRATRDVAKSLDKEVKLDFDGDNLRVDTSIAEVLSNSLLHIVKNSIDHGLETKEERLEVKKTQSGHIQISCCQRDEKVFISIQDDGRGINPENIKKVLIKNGHNKDDLEKMSEPQLFAMIFSPGFSTAKKVTEVSGRGVGMSMVKDVVNSVGGQIHIDSKLGQGTHIQLELPVPKSVLIASCLSVQVDQRRLSIIRDDILRVISVAPEDKEHSINDLHQRRFLRFEDELIPIVRLSEIFQESSQHEQENLNFVILANEQDQRKIAIEIESLLDLEDMVIKNIHGVLNPDSIYRGVTFIDDGSIGLVLNTTGLINYINIQPKKISKQDKSDSEMINSTKQPTKVIRFTTETGQNYALKQHHVYRIESIETEQIKLSGSDRVIPWRGRPLKIMDLEQLQFSQQGKNPEHWEAGQQTQLLILKHDNYFVGLRVHDIHDIFDVEKLETDLANPKIGIMAHIIQDESTIPLIKGDWIFEKAFAYVTSEQRQSA